MDTVFIDMADMEVLNIRKTFIDCKPEGVPCGFVVPYPVSPHQVPSLLPGSALSLSSGINNLNGAVDLWRHPPTVPCDQVNDVVKMYAPSR